MLVRSRAPLRLGLAGGGTDVEPYCSKHGGQVINATIDLYAHCTIEEANDVLIFKAIDKDEVFNSKPKSYLEVDGLLSLHKGVYNRVVKEFNDGSPLSLVMTTFSDVPAGSGLGSSSTLVVAMLKAYVEWLSIPLGDYDIAYLAYQIEREDIGLSGGKQDQYAATFGGFNFMEFSANNRVLVNPLRVQNYLVNEIEAHTILFYTGVSRDSFKIIDDQIQKISKENLNYLSSSENLKQEALLMKEAILKCDMKLFSETLGRAWIAKKKLSNLISNKMIEDTFNIAKNNGAYTGKISGAGGGGFILFSINPLKKHKLITALEKLNGRVINFHFVQEGVQAWRI